MGIRGLSLSAIEAECSSGGSPVEVRWKSGRRHPPGTRKGPAEAGPSWARGDLNPHVLSNTGT